MSSDEEAHRGDMELEKRILQQLRAVDTEGKMLGVLLETFDKALAEDPLVVSRNERRRLLAQVTKAVLQDMLSNLDAGRGESNQTDQ